MGAVQPQPSIVLDVFSDGIEPRYFADVNVYVLGRIKGVQWKE